MTPTRHPSQAHDDEPGPADLPSGLHSPDGRQRDERDHPTSPVARSPHTHRPLASTPRRGLSLEALVPEDPGGVFLTPGLWDRLMAMVAVEHPATAEFSWSTFHFWNRADLSRVSRVGRFLIVPLGTGPKHLMVLATPGARLTADVRDELGNVMRQHELRYLPAATAHLLAPAVDDIGGSLVSVRDDADYVYAISQLAELDGPGSGSRGKAVRRFDRTYDTHGDGTRVEFREGLLSDSWAYRHLLATCDAWIGKFHGHPPPEVRQELAGITSWPRAVRGQRLPVVAMSVDGRPAGVSVLEPTWGATWMGLVFKSDPTIAGSAESLRRHVARRALLTLGPSGLLNIQQDAGVLELRAMKCSYRPTLFRQKFAVVLPGRTPSFDLAGNTPCSC